MAILSDGEIRQIVQEIQANDEVTRRAYSLRRQKMFRGDGKQFLLELISTEFGPESIKEMRLCPINFLKKLVQKLSQVYKTPPTRTAPNASDQALVDQYVIELMLDEKMQKANRYYNLHANTALYCVPSTGSLTMHVVPPHLYSIVPNPINQSLVDVWLFNAFVESGQVAPLDDKPSATGAQGFSRQHGYKTPQDKVASDEKDSEMLARRFVVWTSEQHMTIDGKGNKILLNGQTEEELINPIEIAPVVHLQKDTDNEPWSCEGEDNADMALALQVGLSDSLTVLKHHGFPLLTVKSVEKPSQLTIGINRMIWLKQDPDKPDPSIDYVSPNAPIGESKQLLFDLVGIWLSTNNIAPSSVSSSTAPQNMASGFARLIEQADALEAMKQDQPVMRNAERNLWKIIARWHNWMAEMGLLRDDLKALGTFSEEFDVAISYHEVKPIESESERLAAVKSLRELGLITRKDALKKLHPDMSDEQIDKMLAEIDAENQKRRDDAMAAGANQESEDEEESEGQEPEDADETQV